MVTEIAPIVLKFLAVLAGFGGVAEAVRETVLKFRSRADLGKALRSNAADADVVSHLLEKNDVSGAAAVLQKYVEALPAKERSEAEAALGQKSELGRSSYIREVSTARQGDAEETHVEN